MKSIIISTFISTCIILLSCSGMQEPWRTGGFVKPLRVGHAWIGTVTSYDSSGAITRTQKMSERIVADTLIDNERWAIAQFIRGNDSSEYRLFTYRGWNLWSRPMSVDRTELLEPELWAISPCAVGDTFRTVNNRLKVVKSEDKRLNLHVGEYACIVYRTIYPDSSYRDEYYAPSLGLARMESYRRRADGMPYLEWRYELDMAFVKNEWWPKEDS